MHKTHIQIIEDQDTLLRKIQTLASSADQIQIHCPNFHLFQTSPLFSHILECSTSVKTSIITHHQISEKNLLQGTLEQTTTLKRFPNVQYNIKFTQSGKILYDFVRNLMRHKTYKSLSEAIEDFIKQEGIQALETELNKLKQQILTALKNKAEIQDLYAKFQTSIDSTFQELIAYIQDIQQEGNAYAIKQVALFFFNIINVFALKAGFSNLPLFALDVAWNFGNALNAFLEWDEHKYIYALKIPIFQVLTNHFAPMLLFLDNQSLRQTIVFQQDTQLTCLDLSSFPHSTKTSIPIQGFAVLTQIDLPTQTQIPQNSDLLELFADVFQAHKTPPLFKQDRIQAELKRHINNSDLRLCYIQSYFFNSTSFIQCIQDIEKQKSQTPSSHLQTQPLANFLIISNVPPKHKAGLTKDLITQLGNQIHYGKATSKPQNNLFYTPSKGPIIDYSEYEIQIDSNSPVYVLNLSPFLKFPIGLYQHYEQRVKDIEKTKREASTPSVLGTIFGKSRELDRLQQEYAQEIANYHYIQSFFKQTDELKALSKKEKKYHKEGLQTLEKYFEVLIHEKEPSLVLGGMNRIYKTTASSTFSLCEVYLLALTFYLIKSSYANVKTNAQSVEGYEYIEVDQYKMNVLAQKAHVSLSNQLTLLCFSKAYKQKHYANQECLCIEEIADSFLNSSEPKDIQSFFQDFKTKLKNDLECIQSEISPQDFSIQEQIQTLETLFTEPLILETLAQTLFQDFLVSFFPFAEFFFISDNPSELIKKIAKISLSQWQGESFLKELGILSSVFHSYHPDTKFSDTSKKELIVTATTIQHCIQLISTAKKQILENTHITTYTILSSSRTILKQALNNMSSQIKTTFKDFLKGVPQALIINLIEDAYLTEYEKQKQIYEKLYFLKYVSKHHHPLAIKREEAVYIPMMIYTHFTSFDFQTLLTGTNLCTGGLGEFECVFHHLNPQNLDPQIFLLKKLFGYLCLDELRSGNVVEDESKMFGDLNFFQDIFHSQEMLNPSAYQLQFQQQIIPPNASKLQKEGINRENQKMQKMQDERRGIYEKYLNQQGISKDSAIDCYNLAMEYLQDIKDGIYNTNKDGSANAKKHREFLKALDVIGKNNIRGLYVGIREEQEQEQNKGIKTAKTRHATQIQVNNSQAIRPKIIGRLATTIIMKDGLWLG